MPLGRILRFVDRVTGDNAIGNLAGSLGRSIGRRSRRTQAAAVSAATTSPPSVPAAAGVPAVVPGPPQMSDTFDQTGAVVGGVAGGALGALGGPGLAAIGATAGAQLGQAAGRQIPVPGRNLPILAGGSGDPNAILATLAGTGRGRNSRRVAIEALLYSGALNGALRPPVVFTAPDGRVVHRSDPGFVLITRRSGGRIIKFQMPRQMAIDLGFYKPRRKPIISVRDSQAISRAKRARGRLQRAAKGAGLYCTTSRPKPRAKAPARRRR